MSTTSLNRKIQVVRSKLKVKQTRRLLQLAAMANWSDTAINICKQLETLSDEELGGKYMWMVGESPAYFVQYQIDSYAILRAYGRVVLVWKPKFIEYPSVVKLEDFGNNPKKIKSMQIQKEEAAGQVPQEFQAHIKQHLENFYGGNYFSTEQQEFQTKLVTELKHMASRISKASYWHCLLDNHGAMDVSSRGTIYLRLRIKGVKEKYDKDFILVSKQGQRELMLKDKKMQIMSFVAMLIIFIAVIMCPEDSCEGMCVYRNEMMMLGAAIMMGLMGMRVASRNQNKKKITEQIKRAEQA